MEPDRHLDLDIGDPAWAQAPADIVKAVLGDGPHSITVRADGAAAPTALSAQLLAFLRLHVESGGGTFSVADPSPGFVDAVTLLGLGDAILGPEGVQ
ncbi:hypothetical protein [Rhodovulum euryhalinum]|uniref:STAS domain-containing protein n=1 Tax=Rhodovulum euryhalinum TaxID=35805 RepID=A0A4R2KEX5_9RHOB|nr:hypothetical protein [Rhodovulum euryhalinum]TCO70767.1 hypothetical protein EV655_1088 [Rhodovulum euryhalinum]